MIPTMRRIDISGQRFGRLVAEKDIGLIHGARRWLCRCDCGKITISTASTLRGGNTKSCGCLRQEKSKARFTTHGAKVDKTVTPEYVVWSLMRDRCSNPSNKKFDYYGGKGIKVCQRWDDFSLFLADMGTRPPGLTIDRINADGDYEPCNCRWATRKEQSRNREYCRRVVWDGKEQLLWKLADEYGVPVHTVHQRLNRGWSLDRTLTQPIRRK